MTICKQPTENTLCEVLSMTQLYVLSQDGTSAINLGQFEYVYIGEDNRIKAVNGQKMIRLGDYASRDGAKAALGSMLYYASRNPGAGWYQMIAVPMPRTTLSVTATLPRTSSLPTAKSRYAGAALNLT